MFLSHSIQSHPSTSNFFLFFNQGHTAGPRLSAASASSRSMGSRPQPPLPSPRGGGKGRSECGLPTRTARSRLSCPGPPPPQILKCGGSVLLGFTSRTLSLMIPSPSLSNALKAPARKNAQTRGQLQVLPPTPDHSTFS